MSHMQTDTCHINFFGSDKSCLLTPPDGDSPKYVVMPPYIGSGFFRIELRNFRCFETLSIDISNNSNSFMEKMAVEKPQS